MGRAREAALTDDSVDGNGAVVWLPLAAGACSVWGECSEGEGERAMAVSGGKLEVKKFVNPPGL
jgi:hypothetical protein